MTKQLVSKIIARMHNSGLAKVAVSFSADTFVVNQTLVLRIKFSGENRHLRKAAKRYASCLGTLQTLNILQETN